MAIYQTTGAPGEAARRIRPCPGRARHPILTNGTLWARRWRIGAILLLVAVLGTACGAGGSASASIGQTSPSVANSAPAAACTNPEGGDCLGPVPAGTYSTINFETPVTYTLPEGWANYEDLPGNFLLVPPGETLEGVNAGTSDFIGMADSVAPAAANCEEHAEPGIELSPASMVAWYATLPGLELSTPKPVEVGGLAGVVVDVRLAEGWTGGCPYPGFEGIPMVPLIIGVPPAALHHVAISDATTRIYLLNGLRGQPIAVELFDLDGRGSLDQLDAVVHTFEFETTP